MKLDFSLKTATKTCCRFERRDAESDFAPLYLKKDAVDAAGIDPWRGLTVTMTQKGEENRD